MSRADKTSRHERDISYKKKKITAPPFRRYTAKLRVMRNNVASPRDAAAFGGFLFMGKVARARGEHNDGRASVFTAIRAGSTIRARGEEWNFDLPNSDAELYSPSRVPRTVDIGRPPPRSSRKIVLHCMYTGARANERTRARVAVNFSSFLIDDHHFLSGDTATRISAT